MNPKKILAYAALAACAVSPFFAFAEKTVPADESAAAPAAKKTSTPAGWTDDFEAAKKLAAETDRDLFVLFTGTDWCSWCMRLEKEVFSQKGFIEKLSEKFVPVFIDRPEDKTRLSERAAAQNEELLRRYRIEGFPTVLLMDADGDVFAQTGYVKGGPENYLKQTDELLEKGKNSSEYKTAKAIAALPKDAPDRIARIDEMLSALPVEDQIRNADVVEEILAADPDGSLGYRAKYPFFAVALPLDKEFRALIAEIVAKIDEDLKANDFPRTEQNVNLFAAKRIAERKADFAAMREKATKAQPLFPENTPGAKMMRSILRAVDFYDERFLIPAEKNEAK